jgi:hypothetical protein
MTEPLRAAPASGGSAAADRDALIERLLLAGLDHYFDGHYEQAVNVWTRVAFLERGHGRARAYIERARGALAERQRRSDEMLDQGLDAYRTGDLVAARDLLTRAVADGGSETALVFLQRLGIAEAGLAAATPLPRAGDDGSSIVGPSHRRVNSSRANRTNWIATIAVSVGVAGAILLAAQPIASWLGEPPAADTSTGAQASEPVPVVRTAAVRFARARDLYEQGRLHDALRTLNGIDRGDPMRTDADALTATIQSVLLANTAPTSPGEAAR